MKRAKKVKQVLKKSPALDFESFRWCINNDFQVYIKPQYNNGPCQIAVRRRGITTNGKDYIIKNGVQIFSKETLSEKIFKNEEEASLYINHVLKYLKDKYE